MERWTHTVTIALFIVWMQNNGHRWTNFFNAMKGSLSLPTSTSGAPSAGVSSSGSLIPAILGAGTGLISTSPTTTTPTPANFV